MAEQGNSLSADLTGDAAFQMNGGTGVSARIIRELSQAGRDPRAWFEPAARGGWVYTGDYSFVTSAERDAIIAACGNGG